MQKFQVITFQNSKVKLEITKFLFQSLIQSLPTQAKLLKSLTALTSNYSRYKSDK